jgi:hypothetical protein
MDTCRSRAQPGTRTRSIIEREHHLYFAHRRGGQDAAVWVAGWGSGRMTHDAMYTNTNYWISQTVRFPYVKLSVVLLA